MPILDDYIFMYIGCVGGMKCSWDLLEGHEMKVFFGGNWYTNI